MQAAEDTSFEPRTRDARRVAVARFVGRTGGEAAFFVGVWGLAAYRFHATPSQLAVLMLSLSVSSMLGAAVAGVFVDRYGPTRVIVTAQLLYAPAAVALTFADSLTTLTALVAVFGLTGGPIMTATASYGPYLAREPKDLERTNALIEASGSASFVIGPGLGAVLVGLFSLDAVFYFDVVLTTISACIILGVKTTPFPRHEKHHPFVELAEGLRATYKMRSIRYYVLLGTAMWLGFGAFGALEPLFYRDAVGTGVQTIGWVNSIFGLGILAGALLLPRLPDRVLSARGLGIGATFTGLGTVLYVGSTDLRLIAIGSLAWGVIIGVVEPLMRTLIHIDAPEEIVGRIMGTAGVHRSAGELLPLAVAPALAARFGVQPVLIGGGVLVALIAFSSLGEATAVDRAAGGPRRRAGLRFEPFTAADEPISPNP